MAIKINEFIQRIDRLTKVLPDKLLDVLERAGLDAKADINSRIVRSGTNYKGEPLPPYTPGYLQFKQDVGRYRGHVDLQLGNYSINKRIAAVEARKAARGRKTRTGEERQALKIRRRAKSLPEGGTLWKNIGVEEKKRQGNQLIVTIGARDEINKKKLQGLAKKRGDIMAVSDKERSKIVNTMETGFEKIVEETFR